MDGKARHNLKFGRLHRRRGTGGGDGVGGWETFISWAIPTQESGNLPYHVKTICS